jgi:hypothetical protein
VQRDLAQRVRREAGWVALLLSSLCGEQVTAAELLGEEEPGTSDAERQAASDEFERKKEMLRRRRG